MTDERHDSGHGESAHEPVEAFDREISVRGIVWTAAGILAVTVVAMALMAWMFVGLKRSLERADRAPTPAEQAERARREAAAPVPARPTPGSTLALPEGSVPPPGPQLQPSPEAELIEMRSEEDAVLDGYGWVDRDRGLVRVPIERAMEDLAARGLPVFTPGTGGEGAPAPAAAGAAAVSGEPKPDSAPAGGGAR